MKTIFTVLKKELIVTFRDKRTLFTVILFPAILFPLMVIITAKVQTKLTQSKKGEQLKVAIVNTPESLKNNLYTGKEFSIKQNFTEVSGINAIQKDSLDALIVFNPSFDKSISTLNSENVKVFYKSTNLLIYNRVVKDLNKANESLLKERITQLNISEATLKPIEISKIDIASKKEQIGEIVGGFLPYLFIIICFTGCMYPAIELTTGEKEKKTLETLLTVPASRFYVLLGKVITMTLVGLAAALMTIFGLFISVQFFNEIPKEFVSSVYEILSVKFVLLLLLMLIPLSFFFSGMLSALAVGAKSFKEAQSKIQPMMIVAFLPAGMALIPGIQLDWTTVWIPIFNIALVTKQIMSGNFDFLLYLAVVTSTVIISLISIYFSYKQFSKEKMVLG